MQHRYCSQDCWGAVAAKRYSGVSHPERRSVPRPSYEQLQQDLEVMSYCAVGRKYGVSDNAIRKWIRWYERGGGTPPDEQEGADDLPAVA
jgi:transposase-like protein